MRTWALGPDDPHERMLAADALAGPTDYLNDHIWEIHWQAGRPPALSIETTYARRARAMRIFAAFTADGPTVSDPSAFAQPPAIRCFLPSWMKIAFAPFEGIEVEAEYWVPGSHTLAGRLRLSNTTPRFQTLRVVLFATLEPLEGGRGMSGGSRAGAALLEGRTGDLCPVAFLAGGAAHIAGAVPGLELTVDLAPHAARPVMWSSAAEGTVESSFEAARDLAGRTWDAEIARLERLHSGWVDVQTGDPDWDAALALSQKAGLGAFVGPTRAFPAPSLVSMRTPDHGHSASNDGADHDDTWSGIDAGTMAYVAQQVVYAAPGHVRGLIDNHLTTQEPGGAVDGRPGAGGQRGGFLCPPRLAHLAWEVFQRTGDEAFLRDAFPRLLLFLNYWFSKEREALGYPSLAWDHVRQADADLKPALAMGVAWGESADPRHVLHPDLAAYLAQETRALLNMAGAVQETWAQPDLQQRWLELKQAVSEMWSSTDGSFHYIDRDTHRATPGRLLGSGRGALDLRPKGTFDPPIRVQIRLGVSEGHARRTRVSIEGLGANGRNRREQLGVRDFRWLWDRGVAESQTTYSRLERIRIEGIDDGAEVEVRSPDLRRQDLPLLMPVWAGLAEGAIASSVKTTLMDPDRYGRPQGWPLVPADDPAYAPESPGGPWVVSMPLQEALGAALVNAGYQAEAREVLDRLMASIIEGLKRDGAFSEAYHPERPAGWGRRGHVAGIAPLSLFLKVAGIGLLQPDRIELSGRHPFPWPVTVRWRGLAIERGPEGTRVTFPDGQAAFVEDGMEGTVERTTEPE
jgi:hypothetical protein